MSASKTKNEIIVNEKLYPGKILRVLFFSLFIVIADQVSKFFVKGGTIPLLNINVQGMNYGESINVIGEFFKITFVENPGIAFGIDINNTSKLFLSIFSIIASVGILYYLWKSRHQKLIIRIALALILGGAIGNLIDRMFYGVFYGYAPIFYGKVVDFFNVEFFDFTILGRTYERFPIFNIADSSVTIGVILLLIFYKNPTDEKKVNADGGTNFEGVSDESLNAIKENHSSSTEEKISDAEYNDREKI